MGESTRPHGRRHRSLLCVSSMTFALCLALVNCGSGPSGSATTSATGQSIGGSCVWSATVVSGASANGRVATVLGFTNVSGHVCPLVEVMSVIGLDPGGVARPARQGGFFPIGQPPLEVRPDDRVEMVVTTSSLQLCAPVAASVPISSLTITLRDGSSTTVPLSDSIDAGCMFQFTEFGSWE